MAGGLHYIIMATSIDIKTDNFYNIKRKVITLDHMSLHPMRKSNLLEGCSRNYQRSKQASL